MSRSNRYADHVAAYLREKGCRTISWGDSALNDAMPDGVVDEKLARLKNAHPLRSMKAICASLDRATDIFERGKRLALNAHGREQIVRTWRLK